MNHWHAGPRITAQSARLLGASVSSEGSACLSPQAAIVAAFVNVTARLSDIPHICPSLLIHLALLTYLIILGILVSSFSL